MLSSKAHENLAKTARFIIAFIMSAVLCLSLFALNTSESYAVSARDNSDYKTTSYNVKINVKDDNSAYVTETVTLDIKNPIHGIYRYIPLSNKISFYDKEGNVLKNVRKRIKVEDVSVDNEEFETYTEDGNEVIQIGNPDKTVDGEKTYTFSYRVRMYDDGISDYDEFYYNVIPSAWDDDIDKTEIVVNMPAKFDKDNVHVLVGNSDHEYSLDEYLKYSIEENTITIKSKQEIPASSYITLGVMLDEGYFSDELSDFKLYIAQFVIGLGAAALSIYLWYKRGRDPKYVKTVEFYPPEGITPAEVGYIIDGTVDREDVLALLIYFAKKGYINIIQTSKKHFKIEKVRDISDDAKTFEKTFFRGMFRSSSVLRTEDMGEEFIDILEATQDQIEGQFTERKNNRIFSQKASKGRVFVWLLSFAAYAAAAVFCSIVSAKIYMVWPLLISFIVLNFGYGLSVYSSDRRFVLKKLSRFASLIISLIATLVAAAINFIIMWKYMDTIVGAIIFAVMVGCVYFAMRYMQCRTERGTELLGRILGFREFIEAAEKDKLEMMVEDNPEYFYDVLPYAYVMGVSNKWAKKFENINIHEPSWYYGYDTDAVFTSWIFFHSFNGCMSSINTHITSIEGNIGDIGGSVGGGGFSGGGGFGGGGGGAW